MGLIFSPPTSPVTVVDTPILSGVTFTQYTTTLTGTLLCKEACPPGIKVHFGWEQPGSQLVPKKAEVMVWLGGEGRRGEGRGGEGRWDGNEGDMHCI